MKRVSNGLTNLIALITFGVLVIILIAIFQLRQDASGLGLSQPLAKTSALEYPSSNTAFGSPLTTPTPKPNPLFSSALATPTPVRTPVSGQMPGIYAVSNYGEQLDFEALFQTSPLLQGNYSNNRQMLPTIPATAQPSLLGGANSPNIIIGTDDRVKVNDTTLFPWSAVVQISGRFGTVPFACSGWMLGPSTVATAAHCLYDYPGTKLFASSIIITPAKNSDTSPSAPFGDCIADRMWIINLWQDSGDSRYDYGVLGLTCLTGQQTGNLGYRVMLDTAINGARVNVTGYPGDKGGTTMWFGLGTVTNTNQSYLYYDNDTWSGESGGPVWELINDDCSACVVAIHNSGSPDLNANIGVRIDDYLFDFLAVLQQWQYGRAFVPLILNLPTPTPTVCPGC